MNSYFASVEQAANPKLRGKPIAVGGGTGGKTTIVAACSYEAKAKGVKTGMGAWEAKKICPEIIIVAGDMSKYIYTSSEIFKILRNYTDLFEAFSIDEGFMDVTATKERFGGEIMLAKEIKQRIREAFRLTCSIGIGPNKFLAKLAGELKKPDGLVILRSEDIPEKIKDVPVNKLCGVGRKLEKYLAAMGVRTFLELHRYPREKLIKRFGTVYGDHLWHMGQGLDNSPVMPYPQIEESKSMGHSYTMPEYTSDIKEVKAYLLLLSEQVGKRLRSGNYSGNTVHLTLGFGNYNFWGKQKKLAEYLDDGYDIFKTAEFLFDKNFSGNTRDPFRFVGISVSGLLRNISQPGLFPEKQAAGKILKAVDAINDRYGEQTVKRAATMNTILHEKVGMAPKNFVKPSV